MTSVSQQQTQGHQQGHQHGQQPTQQTQYRVARIVEQQVEGDLVFDLTSSACGDGSVRVIHFNIADHDDDPSTEFPCGIRAIVEELPDDSSNGLTSILLDSGADASVFPLSLMEAGVPASGKGTRLCDAATVVSYIGQFTHFTFSPCQVLHLPPSRP